MSDAQSEAQRGAGGPVFVTTHWSLVLRAGEATSEARDEALGVLCRAYWYPLYVFVRRRGYSSHDAEDMTQGFFAQLLRRQDIKGVDAKHGKFRSFLLAAMKHYLANDWKFQNRQKRGGEYEIFSFDAETAEARYVKEPASIESAEGSFDRSWALSVLDRALKGMRERYVQSGKADLFSALEPCLSVSSDLLSYQEIGERLGLSESAVKMSASRLRKRYGRLIREEVAATVVDEGDVEDELQALFAALKA